MRPSKQTTLRSMRCVEDTIVCTSIDVVAVPAHVLSAIRELVTLAFERQGNTEDVVQSS